MTEEYSSVAYLAFLPTILTPEFNEWPFIANKKRYTVVGQKMAGQKVTHFIKFLET